MAHRSDRRGDPPIASVADEGRTNDWHPRAQLPSWPGAPNAPHRGRRYDCSLIMVPSQKKDLAEGVQIRLVRDLEALNGVKVGSTGWLAFVRDFVSPHRAKKWSTPSESSSAQFWRLAGPAASSPSRFSTLRFAWLRPSLGTLASGRWRLSIRGSIALGQSHQIEKRCS